MDYTLYRIDENGNRQPLPHGQQSRFHTEAEAIARAQELRAEVAALGDVNLPGYVVISESGDVAVEIKDPLPDIRLEDVPGLCHQCRRPLDNPKDPLSRDLGGDCLRCMAEAGDPQAVAAVLALVEPGAPEKKPPEPEKKMYRVRWTEEYCQDREAESAEQAIEERTDRDAFQGCIDSSAELICDKCEGVGRASCLKCNGRGSVPEAA